jgi:hypothetical protein
MRTGRSHTGYVIVGKEAKTAYNTFIVSAYNTVGICHANHRTDMSNWTYLNKHTARNTANHTFI